MPVDLKHLQNLWENTKPENESIEPPNMAKWKLITSIIDCFPQLLSELEAYREMAEEVRGMNMAFSPDPQIQDNDALWKEKRDAILSKLDERLKGV